MAGLELGNVLVAIQPPRGYGDDPVGIYHDPELPPTHHYLACYWWIERVGEPTRSCTSASTARSSGCPGKTLALSPGCAPDAALGDMPLVYPFVVNDPGEGVQAKRRVHAVIVDHLVPPMMRADTYDEMAELEALLDEYARLEVLDPSKLPSLAVRIWSAIERANLQADLGVEERPDDVATLVEHIDGYLCEVKDIQIKDGLHILGQPPRGDQMRGLVSAILRLGSGYVPGLRRAVGAAFGLDEPALVAAAGSAAPRSVPELVERFRGPSASSGDLVDRLEAAQMALLDELAAHDWRAEAVPGVCLDVLGRADDGVERALRFAADDVVPRILRRPTSSTTPSPRCAGGTCRPARPAARRAAGSTCFRRAATSTRSIRAHCPPSSRGRWAAASPTPCSIASGPRRARCRAWSGSSPGERPRCAPRATTWRRSSPCSASGRPGTRSPAASPVSR